MTSRRTLLAATGLFPLVAPTMVPALARAESSAVARWPEHPVRVLVGFNPGGVADVATRLLLEGLRQRLPSEVFVVENRPGASGMLAAATVARATPDGHALLGAPGTITIVPSLMKAQHINVVKDLTPISLFATSPNLLVVNPAFPARTVAEFAAYVKSRPKEELAYASSGIGTTVHLLMGMIERAMGISLRHIPYRSSNESITACVAGEVPIVVSSTNSALPFIRDGKVRPLALSSPHRTSFLPDVPTFAEAGYRDILSDTWFGLFGPAGMNAALVGRIAALCDAVMEDMEMRGRFAALGAEPVGLGPADFAALMQQEVVQFRDLTQAMGLQPE
jgi:tripartite-type tricarboxylate transporter receptor subunit TctC